MWVSPGEVSGLTWSPLLVGGACTGAPSIILFMSMVTLGLISGGSKFESGELPIVGGMVPFICSSDI